MLTLPTPRDDRHSLPEPLRRLGDPPSGRAVFSACGSYRWWLERRWCPQAPRLLFIGLNPSRADAGRDDPTLRRLIGFARGWGFGGLEVLNLFARVGARPEILRRSADPVGAATDAWLRHRLRVLPKVWLGWGNQGGWRNRDREVLELLEQERARLFCLGLTAAGQPRHPLYCPARLPLQAFAASCGSRSVPTAASWPELRVATPSTSC
jgi:hypothetical protein